MNDLIVQGQVEVMASARMNAPAQTPDSGLISGQREPRSKKSIILRRTSDVKPSKRVRHALSTSS